MALDFPTAPSVNDTFSFGGKTWKWDGEKWLMVQIGPRFTTSDTAPTNPNAGDVWIDSTDGSQYIYMDSFWVEFGSDMGPTGSNALSPVGIVNPYAGSTAPTNWMLCYGQAISRTSYAGLYEVVGTTYGVGDGSTTFNLPDLRGRTVAALDNMGGTDAGVLDWANTLGHKNGAQNHTLSSAEMPSHTHTQDPHTHTQNPHSHNLYGAMPGSTLSVTNYGNWWTAYIPNQSYEYGAITSNTATNQNTTATNQNTGGGGAHNNMQPTMLLNYIIKVM